MRSRGHMNFLLAAAASLLGVSPLPRSEPMPRRPEEYDPAGGARRDPLPPRSPFDPPTASQTRRKREKAERASLKAGMSGAGLWRKCRAGGRVRGW